MKKLKAIQVLNQANKGIRFFRNRMMMNLKNYNLRVRKKKSLNKKRMYYKNQIMKYKIY